MKKNVILIVLSSVMLAVGCLTFKVNNQKVTRLSAAEADFNVTTNLDAEKQIHTAAQADYLSYEGDYATIPENLYPDGQKHISDPEAVNLAWDYTVPSGKTVSSFDIVWGKEADLSDGYTIKGTSEKSLDVYNSYLGDNYFKIVANFSDGTKDSSAIKKYKVEDVYPRNLRIEGMTNCRDMGGGRELVDGGRIRQGLIYRTSSTNGWGNGRAVVSDTITNAGKEVLLGQLGCKTEINVNNGGNTNYVNIQNFVSANMWYDSGKHHLYRNAEPLKEVFHTLADKDNYPMFYHCRIGTDRTGLCAILISGLLGVPENLIYQDYLFSNFGNIQEKRYIGEKAGRDNIMAYIDDIKKMPGELFHNKVYNYLISIGIPASELNTIIDILVEGEKPSGNDNYQEVIMAEDFYANGGEMKTNEKDSNKLANPKKYFKLEEGQSIVASFDAKYNGEAYLIAYLGSDASSINNSTKINECIEATLDGNDVEISDERTFQDAGFGKGDGRNYYSAVILGTVDVVKGASDVEIIGVANNLNIGAVSIIPLETIAKEEPQPVVPDQPADGSNKNNEPAKKGCGGSIVGVASIFTMFAFGSSLLIFKKRKED